MMKKAFLNTFVGSILLTISGVALFQSVASTPEMAWSHSKGRCISVTVEGKIVPDGCERAARGEIRAERYIVK